MNEHGFLVIEGKSFEKFSNEQVKLIYIIISKFLGTLIPLKYTKWNFD